MTETAAAPRTASKKYISHPPMRPFHKPKNRPMNGNVKFVDASRGADANDGSERGPWRTIAHALEQLEPGDTLYLRGGTYYENVYVARAGTEQKPITIRSYPNEIATIDGGWREFHDAPETSWVPADRDVPDYFRSTKPYRNARYVLGHFADSMVGLLTYYHRDDIEEKQRTLYERHDNEPFPSPTYVGPGVWHDSQTGYIYCRLSHTNYNFTQPGTGDYHGGRDPRQMPMILAPYGSLPLFLDGATHLILQDLVFRGAGEDTVKMRGCHHVTFDNITIYCGTYGLHARSCGCIKFLHGGMYGSNPPWHVHAGLSLRVYDMHATMPNGKPPTRDLTRLNTHVIMAIEGRTEEQVDYYVPANHNWELAYSDFTDSLDGIHLGGFGVKFHHNRVDRCQDDSIYLTPLTPGAMGGDLQIYNNLLTRVMLPLGFGGMSEPPPVPFYIYRNIIDQRCPFFWSQHREAYSHLLCGHGPRFKFGMLNIYHNTIIGHQNPKLSRTTTQDLDRAYGLSTLAFCEVGVPRRVLNNVFVHVEGMVPPREEFLPKMNEDVHVDGNVHYDLVNAPRSAERLANFKQSELFQKSKAQYAPGWEANSHVGDPKFKSFDANPWIAADYRIEPGSAANDVAVQIPSQWPDHFRSESGGHSDAGAIPMGAGEFRAGREYDDEDLKLMAWLEKPRA